LLAVATGRQSTASGNIKHFNRQDTFVVPAEIVEHPVQKHGDDDFFPNSKMSASTDKKRQRHYSKSKIIAASTDEKEDGEIETNEPNFTDDSRPEISSAFLNENEKKEQDERQALLAKKQAEMDAMQAMRYLQQVEKENALVTKKAWEIATAKEKSRKDEQQAILETQEILLKKQRADIDAKQNGKAIENR